MGTIVTYMKEQLGIVPGKLLDMPYAGQHSVVPYDKVLKAYQMALIFIGLYRPGEMSYSVSVEHFNGRTFTKIMGLKFKHVKRIRDSAYRGGVYMEYTVDWWKNQKDEWHKLVKAMASPCCGKSASECYCPFFDVFNFHDVILHWRENRFVDPTPFNRGGSSTALGKKRANELGTGPEDFVFVNANGTRWRYEHFRQTTAHMTKVFNLEEKKKITPHCFRVGATSTAYLQSCPSLVICFYVEWSVKSLKISHAQYVKITPEALANVPFDILHGYEHNGERFNCILLKPTRWVLRKELIVSEVYGAQTHAGSRKMRLKKKMMPKMDLADPETNFVQFGSTERDFT